MFDQQFTKKQHYIPRMYLKHWRCEDDNRILVITKNAQDNSIKSVTVDDNLFYKDYCYDILYPDGKLYTLNEVEKNFGKYESRHNRLLERILRRCDSENICILDKGTNRIKDFLEFVGLMVIRNPNNDILFSIDNIAYSTSELDDLFYMMFGVKWKIKAQQVVANSIKKRYFFEIVKEANQVANTPEIYFLKAQGRTYFITSDNPVLCQEKWSYIPLSPCYAAFILYDTRINCRFHQNSVFHLSDEEVQKFNRLYWQQDNIFTIIGNSEKMLIDALETELKI